MAGMASSVRQPHPPGGRRCRCPRRAVRRAARRSRTRASQNAIRGLSRDPLPPTRCGSSPASTCEGRESMKVRPLRSIFIDEHPLAIEAVISSASSGEVCRSHAPRMLRTRTLPSRETTTSNMAGASCRSTYRPGCERVVDHPTTGVCQLPYVWMFGTSLGLAPSRRPGFRVETLRAGTLQRGAPLASGGCRVGPGPA